MMLLQKKQQHLIEKVEHIINNEDLTHVREMAKKLLEESDAETLVAALLKKNYADEFNTDSYTRISQALTKGNFKQEESGRRRGNGRSRQSSNLRHGDRKKVTRRDNAGNRIKGEGARKKSRGGKVGGGSARKFGSATKKQFNGSKNKKKFSKPRSLKQYAGGKQ